MRHDVMSYYQSNNTRHMMSYTMMYYDVLRVFAYQYRVYNVAYRLHAIDPAASPCAFINCSKLYLTS